ncbi:integral membrane cytochrome biogenesis protein [Streptomyces sp. NBRC 110035]|uniref:integral membrane cytochrome biogenesis protein n=1 Tax=unclassified Streptomyces TaxID=2593676 RepID=UPI00073C1C7A|nr:hypothetical protein APS67_003787 [Streptomyces sp. AVP053U2]
MVHVGKVPLHTTSLAGGTMFILLGVLFLVFDGTSALPSLRGVDAEFAWEERLSRWAGAVPDRALLLGLVRTGTGRKEEHHRPSAHARTDDAAEEHR